MGKKYITVPFEIKSIDETDPDFFLFEGYASTKDRDAGGDIVEPTAFNEYLKKNMPVMLWQHDRSEPVGVYDVAMSDTKGLFVKGRMPKNDTFVSGRVMPQMKIGAIKSLSIGYRVIKSEWDNETNTRTIKEATLPEISLVTFPMNENARITSMKNISFERDSFPKKFAEKSYRWDAEKAWERVQTFSDTQKACLSHTHIPELCIVDIIQGKAVIVPRALFAVRCLLSGGRAPALPDEEFIKIKGLINELYDDLGLEAPFLKNSTIPLCTTELLCLQKSALAWGLRENAVSREAANYIASLILADADQKSTAEAEKKVKTIEALQAIQKLFEGKNNE